jgi:MFS family permease
LEQFDEPLYRSLLGPAVERFGKVSRLGIGGDALNEIAGIDARVDEMDRRPGQIGAVVATEALAVGATAVFIGRLVDRIGHARVLITTGVITGLAICAEAAAIASNASVGILVAIGAVQGATVPPISPSMRRWPPRTAG